jgi:hypothetical protein
VYSIDSARNVNVRWTLGLRWSLRSDCSRKAFDNIIPYPWKQLRGMEATSVLACCSRCGMMRYWTFIGGSRQDSRSCRHRASVHFQFVLEATQSSMHSWSHCLDWTNRGTNVAGLRSTSKAALPPWIPTVVCNWMYSVACVTC